MAHYDLFVIGGGSGGASSARASAALGAKVGIAEGDKFGGTCVNRGCMPKKWYMYASHYAEDFEAAKSFGWEMTSPKLNWQTLKDNTFKEVTRLNGVYDTMLSNAGVTRYQGFAKFIDQNTVEVNGERITADKFMIAVGAKPFKAPIEGVEHTITSDQVFHLETLPKSILIVGGGYIGVEFAGIFNGLGVDTKLMVRAGDILRGFDEDVRKHTQREMEKKGIQVITATRPVNIKMQDDGSLVVRCNHDKDWSVDQVMLATGRTPNLDHLGLENTGVSQDETTKRIIVDDWQRTNVENIFAIGDVTNTHMDLTPVAINEGRAFADTQFGDKERNFSDFITPTAVFCQPSIGTVGLTEEQARNQFTNIDIYRSTFRPTKYRLSDTIGEEILMKLVVDADTDKVIGAHMVGPDSAEIIQALAVSVRAGATKFEFDRVVGVHPTLAEEFVTMRDKVTDKSKVTY